MNLASRFHLHALVIFSKVFEAQMWKSTKFLDLRRSRPTSFKFDQNNNTLCLETVLLLNMLLYTPWSICNTMCEKFRISLFTIQQSKYGRKSGSFINRWDFKALQADKFLDEPTESRSREPYHSLQAYTQLRGL